MNKRNRVYMAAGVLVGIGFNALAMSNISAGNAGNALHELFNAAMSWAAGTVLACLECEDGDGGDPKGDCPSGRAGHTDRIEDR
ncbi:hypothetical protein [Streptomyces sp. NPDC002209]|uniref:hypothetical protein n=1 Tax=Streptomyces sp. NPDC002209 TaxID=3364638 RepID=UPI00369E6A33